MNTLLLPPTPDSIEKAKNLLNARELVALPTETVYGLAGSATSAEAVQKIFEAKERPSYDPLIVHVRKTILQDPGGPVKALIEDKIISASVLRWPSIHLLESVMKKFWPGPLTLVLPRGEHIPDEVTAGQDTVGIRCPSHPLFQAVLSTLSFPLAAPSANRFGRISPTEAGHVLQELNGRISAVLDGGACSVGLESTIIKIEELPLRVTLLRPGKIGIPELFQHFGVEIGTQKTLGETNQAQQAPGMLEDHYAPRKPLILVPFSFTNKEATLEFLHTYPDLSKAAFLGMHEVPEYLRKKNPATIRILSATNSLEEMARNLFSTLRDLDQSMRAEMIFVDVPAHPNHGLSSALRDRLKRASRNKPTL